MSKRSFRRAHERRIASTRRRESLKRRRTGLAAGAAVGATVLFVPSAQAANFPVTTLADGPADTCDADCTLRDAVTAANATPADDTVTFASGLSGTIRLTAGEIPVGSYSYDTACSCNIFSDDAVTVNGPGSGTLSVSGDANENGAPDDGDSPIFDVIGQGPAMFSGLTLTEGYSSGSGGALVVSNGADVTLADSAITNSFTNGQGGAIRSTGPLTISESTISGNEAAGGGGGILSNGELTVTTSTISGNTTNGQGGGIAGKYGLELTDSVISGNEASSGGGIHHSAVGGGEHVSAISRTTISGNDADYNGAGMYVNYLNAGDRFTVSNSTISGNDSAVGQESSSFGGGIMFGGTIRGDFDLVDSTISGNTADIGGGVSLGDTSGQLVRPTGSLEFDNSTIASNSAASTGGGFYLGRYSSGDDQTSATIPLTSTIVADNTAAGSAQDLDRADGSIGGGFDLSFSLVEAPGDAPLSQTPPGSSLVGVDPQLASLAGNGGPTSTHLPAGSSPAIDKGNAPARLTTDQRGHSRTVDLSVPNAAGGDGTDIGSVELAALPPATGPPPGPSGLPPPLLGSTVNVRPVSGTVFISLPPTAGAARKLITGPLAGAAVPGLKGRRFVRLRVARQVPVRSLLDTRKGTVRITSARLAAGRTQSGTFASGVFQVLQSRARRARGLTELRLKGSSFAGCKPSRRGKRRGRSASTPAQISASRRIRRLRSNATGRFGTRGRHSSATVRGTKWTVTDRCDGTLTSVARGSVTVRDFRRKRNIVVKAGKSYLAKARG